MESDGRRRLRTLHCMKCGHALSQRVTAIKPEHIPISLRDSPASSSAASATSSATNTLTRQVCTQPNCSWVFYNNPLPVVAALVEYPNPSTGAREFILVRGVGWPTNWFGLVTGFLEAKEAPEVGVLREVKEELGLDGVVKDFLGVWPFPRMNQIILAYHVVATTPPASVPSAPTRQPIVLQAEEIEAYKLVPIERLRPWKEGTGLAVREFLQRATGQLVDWDDEAFSRRGPKRAPPATTPAEGSRDGKNHQEERGAALKSKL